MLFATHISMQWVGSVRTTTDVGTNGATTLSRMNFSRYVGHVTAFSSMLAIARCLAALGLGLGLGLDLVSGCLVVVMHTYLYYGTFGYIMTVLCIT